MNNLINDLRSGKISAYDIPPIQVVQQNGKLFSLDNRRLLAFNSAGVDKIPIQIVSLDNAAIKIKFRERLRPIRDEGNYAVIVNRAQRAASLELLKEYNLIKGINRGY